jgi:hypothetical protein
VRREYIIGVDYLVGILQVTEFFCLKPRTWDKTASYGVASEGCKSLSGLFSYTCVWWGNRGFDLNQEGNWVCTAGVGRLWRA